ncbi:hypothetical protein I8H83_05475 [Candidatus Saccharibacteria bacterium]|nr:hypothetical protein [Candidatus Saccharibacteria bacterium]MBH2008023.1 hypothetical protein [Candidatus Saccharibacteria bacterium]
MSAAPPVSNLILSDKMTDNRMAWDYLRSQGVMPYTVPELSSAIWDLNPRSLGPRSFFGYLLSDFRKNGGSLGGKTTASIATTLAQLCVQKDVEHPRGTLAGGGVDYKDHTVGAVLVHEDTMNRTGFWPLVQAIRAEQRRHGFAETVIYVHSGNNKPQLFAEHPVTVTGR